MTAGGEALRIVRERNDKLLAWYRANSRPLPWRNTSDPYRILVAEIMSHQTQVERVIPAYERFVERFPTVDALAVAPLSDVMVAWVGLGYNSRARRLHDAARAISAGGWPTTVTELLRLPGVGPYTAAAVASFAMGRRVPAVDTNLRRVLSRWFGEPLEGRRLEHVAAETVAGDASAWNQAMMDLGAIVCRPRDPRCHECPVADHCTGPDVYVPPRPQPRFEGSRRQVRGAIVRHLVHGPAPLRVLQQVTGAHDTILEMAVDGLIDDGLVEPTDGGDLRLVD